MQVFAKEVMEKVRELDAEKMKTEKAFHDFLPTSVVRDMKRSKVRQEAGWGQLDLTNVAIFKTKHFRRARPRH